LEKLFFDIAIIGSGPAGQKAAIQAAKLNKKVVIIEKDLIGGGSLHTGTMPSKSLREAILDLTGFYNRSFYAGAYQPKKVSISDLNYRLNLIVNMQKNQLFRQFEKNNIQVIYGAAKFIDPHHLDVFDEKRGIIQQIRSEKIIIAAGSKPRNPTDIPFDGKVICDSSQLLRIDHIPDSMIVMGAGVVGMEYASFFSLLGAKVTVLDKRTNILPFLDVEMGKYLELALEKSGLEFFPEKEIENVSIQNQHAFVFCKDGSCFQAETLLFALGREAYADGLDLNAAGVRISKRGYIEVNDFFQTHSENIYAVGDVIGGPSLASTSFEQGRLAAKHACGVETHLFPKKYPYGIYTIPEISSCGYTEEQLKHMGYHYEVGRAYYYEIARNHISGNEPGFFKILFHAETLEILGIHIIGRGATEVIHIGQVAMSFNAKIEYFVDQIFNYPTFAEGYRIAGLNGFNKISKRKGI
jgi:NAD(P) transhydrogenase